MSDAGDVNGDGFDDLIIGAPGADPNGSRFRSELRGLWQSERVCGQPEPLDARWQQRLQDQRRRGDDYSGCSVSAAGDVNGDGFDDLIIGALGADPNGIDSGASYVVFGKASGFAANLNLSTLNGSNGFKLSGVAAGDRSGCSVSAAGDVNGDGFDDLIIGALCADPNGIRFRGELCGLWQSERLCRQPESLDAQRQQRLQAQRRRGRRLDPAGSVSAAGDVNGDGFDDLIIGALGADPQRLDSGASYVVFGKASGFAANLNLSTLDGSNGFKLSGVAAGDHSGCSVSAAGDVNGDGFDDLIIGAHGADPNGSNSGASYVVFGKASGFAANLNLSTLDGSNGFKLNGVAADDYSGRSVSAAGDVNGDGFGDLIIGALAPIPTAPIPGRATWSSAARSDHSLP